ncbi:bifunctional hydroxymethylpyrimidine kinase/phosphomethylpyrimidine kinase [Pontibacillus salicampi]|uniref:Hydroxymethylpyrimidine/phosphomethylpyrimidine kinase n=1 Tax=Pontibacillus salicampi TaxID=1449801 RepID=A0ABV6LPQ6_9BACI
MEISKSLTIAGSDSGGGAGIQADLKTFQELSSYGMSVITAVTSQNTKGVHDVHPIPMKHIASQLEAIATDVNPQAVKTGMLGDMDTIHLIADRVRQYEWKNLVVDPVMVAKGGARLLEEQAVSTIKQTLIPLASVVTPNIPEAEALTDKQIKTMEDRKEAAVLLAQMGAQTVIIKGGHGTEDKVSDLLFDGEEFTIYEGERYSTRNTHGTGCTFSAAITAELAKGNNIRQAVTVAKEFIELAIKEDLHIGSGHGPTNHWAYNQYYKRNGIN